MKFVKLVVFSVILLITSAAHANSVSGKIHTLHINLQSNRAHLYLEGKPTFDGSGCTHFWTGNSLDDIKFRQFVWPLLTIAKTTREDISITVSGCNEGYPKITDIDMAPRE